MSTGLTAAEVIAALRRKYGITSDTGGTRPPEWALLTELTSKAGYSSGARADVFAVRAWSAKPKGHERHLIEIKVARSDLTRELAKPEKMAALGQYAHRWFFATPPGLVREGDDLGPGVGLLEVHPGGVREVRKSVRRPAEPIPDTLFVEVFRRAGRAEQRLVAAAETGDLAARVVALEKALAAAQSARARASESSSRARHRLDSTVRFLARLSVPCRCGATLAPATAGEWDRRHADGSACPQGYAMVDAEALADVVLGDENYHDRLAALDQARAA